MPLIERNNISFHVQTMGKGQRIVMLHGALFGSIASWYFTAAPLLANTHEVMLYDLRGHGKSQRIKTGYDLGTMVSDLEALTADCCDQPLILIGHSYGALIALRFTIDHPERVAKLILIEAPLPPSHSTEVLEFTGKSHEEMMSFLPDHVQAFIQAGGRQSRRMIDTLAFLAIQSSFLKDLTSEPDISNSVLAGINCPVSLIYGKQSPCREVGDRLNRVIPNSRLTILPGGHSLHLDSTAALLKVLEEFVHA